MPAVPVNGTEIFYDRAGSGPALVFASGLGGHGGYWAAQVGALMDRFDCITFDHRGVGRSGPAAPPFSVSGLAKDVLGLLDALGVQRAAFVGHSTGGAMGQWLAQHAPDRFAAMALTATWRRCDPRFGMLFRARLQALEEIGVEAYVRASLPLLFPIEWFDAQGDGLEAMVAKTVASQPPRDVLAGRLRAIIESDHDQGAFAAAMPVLMMASADDPLVPPPAVAAVGEALGTDRYHQFDHGAHHFPQTRATDFNAMLNQFLTDTVR
jgi:aminoacrylate hydrolase